MPSSSGKVSQAAGFVASLAIIFALWSVTPLSYLYVAWTALHWRQTILGASLSLRLTLHFLILAYASCAEIPFSLYYRYLALRANARWDPPASQASSAQIRAIFRRCLESGLSLESANGVEDPLSALVMGEVPNNALPEEEQAGLRRRTWSSSVGPTLPLGSTHLDEHDPRAIDFRNSLRGWFYHCPFESILRENIVSWLCWSLYGRPVEELQRGASLRPKGGATKLDRQHREESDSDELVFLEHCLELVEARVGRRFAPGHNPKVKVIRLTLDPVKVASRPLLLYLIVFAMQKLAISKAQGFNEYQDGNTRYLLRIPSGWVPDASNEATRPLLFIHGLGMGMAQYSTLLDYLAHAADLQRRPLIVLIQPWISMSFFDRSYLHPPTQESCTSDFRSLSQRWGFDRSKFTVLSHSNGSIVHGWLLKTVPDLVVRSCFVDPVCFCLWEGSVCINFLYKRSRTPFDFLMRYFVSTELGVALVMQRSFQWSSNLLFPAQIPNLKSKNSVAFFLAGADVILDAQRVRKYLLQHGVEEEFEAGRGGVFLQPGQKHGGSLVQRGVMRWVAATGDQSDRDAVH